jgi:hypothetical protein
MSRGKETALKVVNKTEYRVAFSHSHSLQNNGHRRLLPGRKNTRGIKLKLSRRIKEIRLKLPSSTEIKNAWSYASTIPHAITAQSLIKHRDNGMFTFT